MDVPRPESELENSGRTDGRTTGKLVQKRSIDIQNRAMEYFWDGGSRDRKQKKEKLPPIENAIVLTLT